MALRNSAVRLPESIFNGLEAVGGIYTHTPTPQDFDVDGGALIWGEGIWDAGGVGEEAQGELEGFIGRVVCGADGGAVASDGSVEAESVYFRVWSVRA